MSFKSIIKDYFSGKTLFEDDSYVEYLHREAVRYVEGDQVVYVDLYMNPSLFSNQRTILASEINVWLHPEQIKIPDDKRIEIVNKIIGYCKKNKIKYVVM